MEHIIFVLNTMIDMSSMAGQNVVIGDSDASSFSNDLSSFETVCWILPPRKSASLAAVPSQM